MALGAAYACARVVEAVLVASRPAMRAVDDAISKLGELLREPDQIRALLLEQPR